MNSAPHKVAIVVDREFQGELAELAATMHVWVCDTPSNRSAAEVIWGDSPEYDLESGVTTFDFSADSSSAENVAAVLPEVDLHHGEHSHEPPWSVILVIGCSPNKALETAFSSFGAEVSSVCANKFEAKRPMI